MDVILETDSLVVTGPPESVTVALGIGEAGPRGTRVYANTGDPNTRTTLDVDTYLLDATYELIEGDLYVRLDNTRVYYFTSTPGGVQWEEYLSGYTTETLTYAGTMSIDVGGPEYQLLTLTGDVSFQSTGHVEGKVCNVRVSAGASTRNLSFTTDWVFLGTKPTTIASGKTGLLTLRCLGNAATDVLAEWVVEQ